MRDYQGRIFFQLGIDGLQRVSHSDTLALGPVVGFNDVSFRVLVILGKKLTQLLR